MQSITTSYQSVSENTGTLAGGHGRQEFFLYCNASEKAGSRRFLSQINDLHIPFRAGL